MPDRGMAGNSEYLPAAVGVLSSAIETREVSDYRGQRDY